MDPKIVAFISEILPVLPLATLMVFGLIFLSLSFLKESRKIRIIGVALTAFLTILSIAFVAKVGDEAVTFANTAKYIYGLVIPDGVALIFSALMVIVAFLSLLLSDRYLESAGIERPIEYYFLALMSLLGGLVVANSADFILMFLGIELLSIAIYCMCGAAVKEKRSPEAALKYFFTGAFASAIYLYGAAMIFGATGSTKMGYLAVAFENGANPLIIIGSLFILVGALFKLGVFPFHFWVADVYQGAPTPTTVFMSCVVKLAAFALIYRLIMLGMLWPQFPFVGIVWTLAILTMTFGNLVAMRQRSLKRMLAYSSVAQVGYLLVGVLGQGVISGPKAALGYLIVYCLLSIVSFGCILVLERESGIKDDDIGNLRGLYKSFPLISGVLALSMIGLSGLPPVLGALLGKAVLFYGAVQAGYVGLVIVATLNSAISCYYYLRVIVAIYFMGETKQEETQITSDFGLASRVVLVFSLALVILLGIFPTLIFDSAAKYLFIGVG